MQLDVNRENIEGGTMIRYIVRLRAHVRRKKACFRKKARDGEADVGSFLFLEVAELLLDAGGALAVDAEGRSALHCARTAEQVEFKFNPHPYL